MTAFTLYRITRCPARRSSLALYRLFFLPINCAPSWVTEPKYALRIQGEAVDLECHPARISGTTAESSRSMLTPCAAQRIWMGVLWFRFIRYSFDSSCMDFRAQLNKPLKKH